MIFCSDETILLRSTSSGRGARVPPDAITILAFCGTPRTVGDVIEAFGPRGKVFFDLLSNVGILVKPDEANETPVFFSNFASVEVHRRMLDDQERVKAYRRAIEGVVRPDMVVLDAGSGSCLLACLAAQAGARRVYAVERSEIVQLARSVISRSGLDDQVQVIHGDFRDVVIPEPVDVIVTETFGALALAEGGQPDLVRCARNNLTPHGQMVPRGIELWLALVCDDTVFNETVGPFTITEGIDFTPFRHMALQKARTVHLTSQALLSRGERLTVVRCPHEGPATGSIRFSQLPAGRVTGLLGWFTLDLAEGVTLPTGPDHPDTHWGQSFLPLTPMTLSEGASVQLDVQIDYAPDDRRAIEIQTRWQQDDETERMFFHRAR